MTTRKASIDDLDQIRQLFYDTIKSVNRKDYHEDQISAWASSYSDIDKWTRKVNEQYFLVAEIDNEIVGFASLTDTCYLDFMYVHKDYQRQGIATQLFRALKNFAQKSVSKEIVSYVSITARPFFEKQGFKVFTEQMAVVKGIRMTNYKMILRLAD